MPSPKMTVVVHLGGDGQRLASGQAAARQVDLVMRKAGTSAGKPACHRSRAGRNATPRRVAGGARGSAAGFL